MTEAPIDWPALLARLAEPFPTDQLKWRAGAVNRDKTKAIALAYAEPRSYEDRLNAVCPGAWHVDFQPWGEQRIICRLTIHALTRSSTGESGDANPAIAGTSAEAQAFKRACSKYGLGRYLYDLPTTWVAYDPNTKRLLETPRGPTEQQPQPPSTPTARRSTPSTPSDTAEPIGTARAVAMHGHLARLGLQRDSHFPFASDALNRPVQSLAALSEADARTVWSHAVQWALESQAAA